jgi:hypothetical protein
MLKYPLKVCPIPGIWVQSVPVTAIPWGGMNTVLLINASTMRLVTNIKKLLGVNNSIFECEYN